MDLTSIKQARDESVLDYFRRFEEIKNRCVEDWYPRYPPQGREPTRSKAYARGGQTWTDRVANDEEKRKPTRKGGVR